MTKFIETSQNMDEIKLMLNQIHKVDPILLEYFISQFEPVSYSSKSIITAAGNTERYTYFVLDGIQKSYFLNDKKEYIVAFTYAPSFSGIPESFFAQKPSSYYLSTITESSLLRLSFERLQLIMEEHRDIETLYRKATELFVVGFTQRYQELMVLDIESRFRAFMQRSSHLINKIPRKDIASYLNIAPPNLSKLLNNNLF